MIWIKTEKSIPEVTRYYMETIGDAFKKNGEETVCVEDLKDIDYKKGDYVVVSNAVEAVKAIKRRYRYIYWAQGIWSEESLMKHGSRLRFYVTGMMEKMSLKKAAFCVFVSEYMKSFYEKKYRLNFGDDYYIMPCLNDTFHSEAFATQEKYEKNVFCYIGSTAVWQCFEETLRIYSEIEKTTSDARIILLVKDFDYAEKCIEKYNIKNYVLDYVSLNELGKYLNSAKYGFVIREDNAVNNVATPTKIETYICYGVIPVYSDCLLGIREILKDSKFSIPYRGNISDVDKSMNESIEAKEVLKDFATIYEKAYNREAHITKLAKKLSFRL